MSPNEVEYTYVISVQQATDEGGDNDGGESGSVVYTASAANGSSVTITATDFTATSGTVIISRVSSYGSTTVYTCTYTVDDDGKGTLAEIDGGGVPYGGYLTVASDGTLLTYTYSGTTYELEKS